MEKENWIKWLQARIPTLKESHNEFWIALALDGYLEGRLNEVLRQPPVIGSVCKHDLQFKKMGQVGRKVLKCSKCGFIAN